MLKIPALFCYPKSLTSDDYACSLQTTVQKNKPVVANYRLINSKLETSNSIKRHTFHFIEF
ncbi:MAG: hypothetical protein JWQ57_4046 [Mucilaginibacter sp.]|nr:hypothetical protein [Mucilaginibacter sp.]